MYGRKLKLMKLFDTRPQDFLSAKTIIYCKQETVRYLVLDLVWKPVKGVVRFILIESSRGRIILMSSDLTIEPLIALNLYTARVRIESLFASLKNLLGGLAYHFWSKYLAPVSRRPRRGSHPAPVSSNPDRTANTLAAIQKFMALHMIVLGTLQLMAATFGDAVREHARCWLRTPSGAMPSDFISRTALANVLREYLRNVAKNPVIAIIRRKQIQHQNNREKTLDKQREVA